MSIHGPPGDDGVAAFRRLVVLVAEVAICVCALIAAIHDGED